MSHKLINECADRCSTYLQRGAGVRERTAEEGVNDVDDAGRHVVFESSVGVLAVVSRSGNQSHVEQEAFEQRPHVTRRVNLLHLHFRVDVAVIQEVYINLLDLHDFRQIINVANYSQLSRITSRRILFNNNPWL